MPYTVRSAAFLLNYLKWRSFRKVWKCKCCIFLKEGTEKGFNVFHRPLKSVMCVNWFGWLCHFEGVVRCLEPGNNTFQSVCVVMLCYGFVLLCLSSQPLEEWTSLTRLRENAGSLALSDRFAQYSFASKKLGQGMNSHLLLACSAFQCTGIYYTVPQAFTAPN